MSKIRKTLDLSPLGSWAGFEVPVGCHGFPCNCSDSTCLQRTRLDLALEVCLVKDAGYHQEAWRRFNSDMLFESVLDPGGSLSCSLAASRFPRFSSTRRWRKANFRSFSCRTSSSPSTILPAVFRGKPFSRPSQNLLGIPQGCPHPGHFDYRLTSTSSLLSDILKRNTKELKRQNVDLLCCYVI